MKRQHKRAREQALRLVGLLMVVVVLAVWCLQVLTTLEPHDHHHDHDHNHHDNEHTNDHDHAHRDTTSTSQVQLPLDDGTDRRFEVHPFIKSIVPSVWTRSQWPSSKLDPSVFIIGAQKAGTTSLHSWMLGAGITAPRDCAQGILIQRISSISISISEAPLVDSLGK